MKTTRIFPLAALLLLLLVNRTFGQNTALFVIEPFPLEITFYKTVNLIFPFAIKSVDRGSRDVLAQKAREVENILQVKAASKGFEQTNLTVITSDGKLYSFIVNYSEQPLQLNIELIPTIDSRAASALFDHSNQASIRASARKAASDQSRLRKISDRSAGAALSLSGVYTDQDLIFFRLRLANRSRISYEIETLRFFIHDTKRPRRTAVQERELIPVDIDQDTSAVGPGDAHVLVFALNKFTIADGKHLSIQLTERDGGRQMQLRVANRILLRAKPLG